MRLDAADPLRVLFVGNSLTYTNDLPRVVAALARSGHTTIEVGMIAMPNASIEDHWNDGRARKAIASKRWDVVVMQQGPSSLPSSRANLVEWSRKLADDARAAGARCSLFSVWPDSSRRAYLDDVIESYRVAAVASGCTLLPASSAWKEAWKRSGRLSLWGADGFHPSEEGSYLAALTIWAVLTGEDPLMAPAEIELEDGKWLKIKEKRARLYREATAAAIRQETLP